MGSLVLEGGTFRPIFSAGVMDAMLDQEVMFPYCIGVSAGITNGVSYISKQKNRNLDILLKFRHDKRYVGKRNFLKCRSLFGIDFVFDTIPNEIYPFDWETFTSYKGTLLVGATNAKTGQIQYFDGMKLDKKCSMLRATCAIPLVFPEIMIEGTPYYDGGLVAPIPIRKAIEDGNQKHLIVLTRPKEYRKKLGKSNQVASKVLKRKYPKLESILLKRHTAYNETVQFCEQLEKEGKALILRPTKPIDSMEKNLDTIKETYQMGYEMALQHMEQIREICRSK
ncbi:MAG: patatin family protein [Firmicutes bacterium]|uniref:Patatin family protein n=1 Tax=Candidatus Scybalomonas excrementavium TaxID=2840943 RepID=A0A9D9N7U4_9FIRM|nr:patatin family protein [Candidatus Scybalomonas excrementavium]